VYFAKTYPADTFSISVSIVATTVTKIVFRKYIPKLPSERAVTKLFKVGFLGMKVGG
jgi:hypothetical protein